MKKTTWLATHALALLAFGIGTASSDISNSLPLDQGYISGSASAPAIIKVWEEKRDNTKGTLLIDERWIQRDEKISVPTETGRIIFDYKYRADDTWKTDVHAWCHNGETTKVP